MTKIRLVEINLKYLIGAFAACCVTFCVLLHCFRKNKNRGVVAVVYDKIKVAVSPPLLTVLLVSCGG